ncbi:MAG: M20/M25/M40 family metallo-hydrolase, partial [Candidatus Uhrbacteria bacterium]|nr:M20/M25/M40 family metallo-hydrolase [Candidatus Uhrbacteria bacterium]
ELVAIDSHHPDEAAISAYITARFDAAGIAWKKDSFGNLYVYIPGTGEPVLLSTHIDIPEPAPYVNPIIEGDIIRSDGTSILGADPKTGLAVILELAQDLARGDGENAPVEILLTRGEEKGLLGALNADYSLLTAKIGFVLDEDGPVNRMTVKAPGYMRFDASFVGKVVHVREPEKGINALQVFCHAVRDVPWGHACEGVTWNIGQFQSGTARNSVPRHATVSAELRSFDTQKLVQESQRIEDVFCAVAHQYGAICNVEKKLMFEGYEYDTSHPFFDRVRSVYEHFGLEPEYHETYGGSDVNVLLAHGIMAVTLGSAYYNAHEYTEYADLAEMARIYEFLDVFLRR